MQSIAILGPLMQAQDKFQPEGLPKEVGWYPNLAQGVGHNGFVLSPGSNHQMFVDPK